MTSTGQSTSYHGVPQSLLSCKAATAEVPILVVQSKVVPGGRGRGSVESYSNETSHGSGVDSNTVHVPCMRLVVGGVHK